MITLYFVGVGTASVKIPIFYLHLGGGFQNSSHFIRKHENKRPVPYSLTNAGLSMKLPVLWRGTSFIEILGVESYIGHKNFGVAISGHLGTGRLYRNLYPTGPIPLYDNITNVSEIEVFISERYSYQRKPDNDQSKHLLISSSVRGFLEHCRSAVLPTFDVSKEDLKISTIPPKRFGNSLGYVELERVSSVDDNGILGLFAAGDRPITLANEDNRSEGVLVRLQSRQGTQVSLLIASTFAPREEESSYKERVVCYRYEWHYCRVPLGDPIELLLSSSLKDSPERLRALQAVESPSFAQSIDSAANLSGISVSMAKEQFFVNSVAVCHIHLCLSQLFSTKISSYAA